MPRSRITLKQRNALSECFTAGRLIRRRDGWAEVARGYGAHSFATVNSLLERGLLETGKTPLTWQATLTKAGREAIGR